MKTQMVKSSRNSLGFSSCVQCFFMTNMAAIVVPDIVVIKPRVSLSKLNTSLSWDIQWPWKSHSKILCWQFGFGDYC